MLLGLYPLTAYNILSLFSALGVLIIEENFPNLRREMSMNIQEAYRTPNRLDQNRNSSLHIIVKTPNALNKKAVREKGQVTYKGYYQNYTRLLTGDYES